MLAIFLDTIVLFGILWWFLQNDMPDFKFVFLIAFGLAIINLLLGLFVAPIIGIYALIPSVILTGLVLMFYCHLPCCRRPSAQRCSWVTRLFYI